MPDDSWRAKAEAVIIAALTQARREGLSLEEATRRVDAAYPFGERSHYPYKAWLAARRELLAEAARLFAWEQGGPVMDPAAPLTPMEAYLEGLDER